MIRPRGGRYERVTAKESLSSRNSPGGKNREDGTNHGGKYQYVWPDLMNSMGLRVMDTLFGMLEVYATLECDHQIDSFAGAESRQSEAVDRSSIHAVFQAAIFNKLYVVDFRLWCSQMVGGNAKLTCPNL
jgi:hypothetical protein